MLMDQKHFIVDRLVKFLVREIDFGTVAAGLVHFKAGSAV